MKKTRTVIDGNAFYEIDEECMENRRQHAASKEKADSKKKNSGLSGKTGNGGQK